MSFLYFIYGLAAFLIGTSAFVLWRLKFLVAQLPLRMEKRYAEYESRNAESQLLISAATEDIAESVRTLTDSQSLLLNATIEFSKRAEVAVDKADQVATFYYLMEHSLRELRGQVTQARAGHRGVDICGVCEKPVTQYFVDGAGKTVCINCGKEGFLEAVRRGTARV